MRTYIIRRLLYVPFMLVGMSLVIFFLLVQRPGDAAVLQIGLQSGGCEECIRLMQEDLGLDRPFFEQYWDWLSHAARGDFGTSLKDRTEIGPQIRDRMPNTIVIGVFTVVLTLLIGLPVGVFSAVKAGTLADYFLRTFSVLGLSIPSFWLGTLIVYMPVIWWGWTPLAENWVKFGENPIESLYNSFWPSLTLAIGSSAYLGRIIRQAMIDTLASDHVRTARAKGLRETVVILRHVFRTSLVTLLTVVGIQFGTVLGGSVVIENIYGIPGMGDLLYKAVLGQDYWMVLSTSMVFATLFILVTLLVDVLYAYVDPRIRY